MVHLNIGVTHYKTGDYAKSFEHRRKSHRLGVEGDWTHRQCFPNIALGNVYRMPGNSTLARQHLHTAYNQAQGRSPGKKPWRSNSSVTSTATRDNPISPPFYARAMAIG